MSRDWKIAVLALSVLALLAGAVRLYTTAPEPLPVKHVSITAAALTPAPAMELPPAEPSREVPTLAEVATENLDRRVEALANELGKMWTRNPDQLVEVIDEASRAVSNSPSVTLLLAIAHAETNGKILDVSEAGAVGLAQATPIACRQEELDGKLFVTDDYLTGARAYIMKKPLGDADTIASLVVARDDAKTRRKAKKLLESAFDLRLEGVDELQLLEPYGSRAYFAAIREQKLHNLAVLKQLRGLLDHGSRAELRKFRDRVRSEYRDMKRTQVEAWLRYQTDLAKRRDTLLSEHFGLPATTVKKSMPYEAGEYLASELDERFSARQMAAFLVRHLERKTEEARRLTRSDARVEEMTAALYNGGSHNVKRMLAGLIGSLPETEKYMKKVPATRRRLDHTIAEVERETTSASIETVR